MSGGEEGGTYGGEWGMGKVRASQRSAGERRIAQESTESNRGRCGCKKDDVITGYWMSSLLWMCSYRELQVDGNV